MKETECLVLMAQPRRMNELLAQVCTPADGMEAACIMHGVAALVKHSTALPVLRVVAEVAEHARPVELGGQEVQAQGRVSAATIDVRLLSALDLTQDVDDVAIFVEGAEVSQDPVQLMTRATVGWRKCTCREIARVDKIFSESLRATAACPEFLPCGLSRDGVLVIEVLVVPSVVHH
jgi:hypothetical protein